MKLLAASLVAWVLAGALGCAQTDPESVCSHIARLQHGGAPNAAERVADYRRLCKAPMTEAKVTRPAEYRCWSKCIVETQTWDETVRCDGCVGSATQFELFQLSKTRKKQQQGKPKPGGSSAPAEGGACAADAACQ